MEEKQNMDSFKKSYRRVYSFLRPFVGLLYPNKIYGQENVPEGPVIICANHSNYVDPLLVSLACGKDKFIRFMAKKELFSVPVVGTVLRRIGTFPVDRERSDIEAIRVAMKCLRSGEKMMMFPEGTRIGEDGSADAKTGAVRIAAKMHVPIIPVYIPRSKKFFHHIDIVVGKPYYVSGKTHEDFSREADELMERISEIGQSVAKTA